MATRLPFRLLTALVLLAASLSVTRSPALAADGVVGTGTPASCTEVAFNTVLSTVQGSGGGTITFDCGPVGHTIVFTAPKAINSAVALDGAGRITLSGGDTTSLFTVNFGDSLTLRGLTLTRAGGAGAAIGNFGRLDVIDSQLTNNVATSGPGGAISSIGTAALTNTLIISNTAAQSGGGVYNAGTLTISGGQISGNRAATSGGGIYSTGTVTLTQMSLFNNTAAVEGGGLYSESASWISTSVVQANSSGLGGGIGQTGGTLTLNQVLVSDNGDENDAGGNADRGGGVYLSGPGVYSLTAVTFWRNRATFGGGIAMADGSLTLLNSTLSDNRAQFGGGLHTSGGVTSIQHVTITANLAIGVPANPAFNSGGGIYRQAGTIDLKNSLLSGNRRFAGDASDNCGGPLPTASFSLSSDGTCAFGAGRDNVALPLGPLQNNGGFTSTHRLPQGSPAIDAGSNSGCPATDQRGLARPVGATCDVGAIEATASDFVTRVFLPALQK